MRPLLGLAAAASLDKDTRSRFGLGEDQLMESAARGMYQVLKDQGFFRGDAGPDRPIVALCGTGNNAGDALAVLRMAAFEGLDGLVAVVPDGLSAAAAERLAEARAAGVAVVGPDGPEAPELAKKAGLVLDGVAGTGVRGPLRRLQAGIAALAELASCPVVSVDIPSGVAPWAGGRPGGAVRAAASLCVAPVKAELYYPGWRPSAGRVLPIDGVFPRQGEPSAWLLEDDDFEAPALDADAHKGTRGALAVYGGSEGTLGAPVLAARAGSAAGAGTVTLIIRDDLYPLVAGSLEAQMVRPRSLGAGRAVHAAVVGPGMGLDQEDRDQFRELWDGQLPLVVDADALRMLAEGRPGPRPGGAALVLTPHLGEARALLACAAGEIGQEALERAGDRIQYDTLSSVRTLATAFGAVVVLKSSVTWIGSPDGIPRVYDGRQPELATGGSGDVLAGVIGGLLARGVPAMDAATAAVLAHGWAGRRLASERGFFDAAALPGAIARRLHPGA